MKHNILKSFTILTIGLCWACAVAAQNQYTVRIVGTNYATCIVTHNGDRYTASTTNVEFTAQEGDKIKLLDCIPFSDAYDNTVVIKIDGQHSNYVLAELNKEYTVTGNVLIEEEIHTLYPQEVYVSAPKSYTNITLSASNYFESVDNISYTLAFSNNTHNTYRATIPAGYHTFKIKNGSTSILSSGYRQIPLTSENNCFVINDGGNSGSWGEIPPQNGEHRLLYVEHEVTTNGSGEPTTTRIYAHPSDIFRFDDTNKKDTVSLHIFNQTSDNWKDEVGKRIPGAVNNPAVVLQKFDGSKWVDVQVHMVYGPIRAKIGMAAMPGRKGASPTKPYDTGIEIIKNDTKYADKGHAGSGVWNFIAQQDGSNVTLLLDDTYRYEGDYYIRASNDVAAGGWGNYRIGTSTLTYSEISQQNSNFSHYFCKHLSKEKNVEFTIANDYGLAISDTLSSDNIISFNTLPTDAEVRFSWNDMDNAIRRAYIAAVKPTLDNKVLLTNYNSSTSPLIDNTQWIYQADINVQPQTSISSLTATYNNKEQTFVTDRLILGGSGSKTYPVRLIYDFKTNELISAYVPRNNDKGTTEIEAIETNLMLIREGHGEATQLVFKENNFLETNQRAYGVIEFTKESLSNSDNIYKKSLYWISFPFDVKVRDAISFGDYGVYWLIQRYDGAKRAEGLWLESDPVWVNEWNAWTGDSVLHKNQGYVLAIDPELMLSSGIFNTTNKVGIYFPSAEVLTNDIVYYTEDVTVAVPEHKCTVNRNTPLGDRRIYDSNWNVIGVPSYANSTAGFDEQSYIHDCYPRDLEDPTDLKFYYRWDFDYNKYKPISSTSQEFKPLHSYMVQYAGNLTWKSVVNEKVPSPLAAKKNTTANKEILLHLELQQNNQSVDKTYIQMQDEGATEMFDMNQDMCKIINAGANIYSLIPNEEYPIAVAGNVIPNESTIVPLGLEIADEGEYTFAMPNGTNGNIVYLIDYYNNTTTNLLLEDYTVEIKAGTNHTQFALQIEPNKVVTNTTHIATDSNKNTTKYLIDGQLYLLRNNTLYDAQGRICK